MIEVKVKKKLGEFVLDAFLQDAGFICLSGRNGSGKTTLLKLILGLITPDEGYVRLNSLELVKLPIEKRGIAFISPDSFIPHLEVTSHLLWGAKIRGIEVDPLLLKKVKERLGITYEGRVDKLSLGMKERVALGTVLISRPQAILIDEVFSNIDDQENFMNAYRLLVEEQKIDLIFTSQRATDGRLAEHHYNIDNGCLQREF